MTKISELPTKATLDADDCILVVEPQAPLNSRGYRITGADLQTWISSFAGGGGGGGGSTVRSGAGAPAAGLGANGDFYIDTASYLIYGPKTAGAWGSGTSLVGPQGPQGNAGANGAQGPQGPAGTNGTNGTNGADGKTVRSGSGAPSAGLGVDGDFYINTAANTIYGPKAAGAWGSPTSLVGPQGPAGSNGTNGTNGADGKTIRSGSGVPSAGLGVDGDFYIDTAANTIYGPKTAGAWGSPTSIVGPQGTAGTNGTNGQGVATGGATGTILRKNSATDFDTGWVAPQTLIPIEINAYVQGVPINNEVVARYVVTQAFTFPTNLTTSRASANAAATASTTFNIARNGTNFGTIVFAAAGTTGTFTAATPPAFAVGDVLTIVNQATADTTLANIAINLVGTRS